MEMKREAQEVKQGGEYANQWLRTPHPELPEKISPLYALLSGSGDVYHRELCALPI